MTSLIPKKLAIYYGWPSVVNATYTVNGAANVFKDYDTVIFGAGLEDNTHGDHQNTIDIINHPDMANTDCYGYIVSTDSLSLNQTKIDNWLSMGVNGIFCDNFGYDWGVTRSQQNDLINYIHSKSLSAFVNAWDPDDVFSNSNVPTFNPSGTSHVLGSNDYYLAESFQIINGGYQDTVFWKTKSDKMVNYKNIYGTKMATVTTTNSSVFDTNKWDYSYMSAVLYNFDLAGWGELYYSASSGSLPFRPRAEVFGDNFTGNIVEGPSNVFSRSTNVGIKIDTVNHTVNTLI